MEKFHFDNGAGATVPGYLIRPKELRGKAPAILYCHWHGGEYDIGKEELFQAKHTPESPGPAFAQRGFVVLGIDAYCFGERNGHGPGGPAEKGGAGEQSASKFNLWVGRTLWGMMLRDDLMALDYLASRPEVDARRIGVTGMSMGATRSWWLMALDERIKTAVAVACLTRYQNLIDRASPVLVGVVAGGIYVHHNLVELEAMHKRGERGEWRSERVYSWLHLEETKRAKACRRTRRWWPWVAAASSAKASAMAARNSDLCPSTTPISSSRSSARNWGWWRR